MSAAQKKHATYCVRACLICVGAATPIGVGTFSEKYIKRGHVLLECVTVSELQVTEVTNGRS